MTRQHARPLFERGALADQRPPLGGIAGRQQRLDRDVREIGIAVIGFAVGIGELHRLDDGVHEGVPERVHRGKVDALNKLLEARQQLAREYGATDIVAERGAEGIARIKELTRGIGADAVLECVGTQESMQQAIGVARPGGYVSYVGVPHGVSLDGQQLFFAHVHLHGGPAPVRRFLPHLVDLVWNRTVDPGKVFDLRLPLAQVAEGYRAMDERRAIKALLQP